MQQQTVSICFVGKIMNLLTLKGYVYQSHDKKSTCIVIILCKGIWLQ
jgi:hypothetical protein